MGWHATREAKHAGLAHREGRGGRQGGWLDSLKLAAGAPPMGCYLCAPDFPAPCTACSCVPRRSALPPGPPAAQPMGSLHWASCCLLASSWSQRSLIVRRPSTPPPPPLDKSPRPRVHRSDPGHAYAALASKLEPAPSPDLPRSLVMALEPGSGAFADSPGSSGRDSPIPRQWRNQLGGGLWPASQPRRGSR